MSNMEQELLDAINADRAAENQPGSPEETPTPDGEQSVDLKALLDTLPPEAKLYVEQREKEMQGDYTRKTQALAKERETFEADLTLLEGLRNDPYAALEFYNELGAALKEAGLSDEETAEVIQNAVSEVEDDGESVGLSDPESLKKLKELEEWREGFLVEQELLNIDREILDLREKNPWIKDEHVDVILRLAATSPTGSIEDGFNFFATARDEGVQEYADKKINQPNPEPTTTGGGGVTPKKFKTLEEAHPAAEEYLRNALNQNKE